jgi:peptidoglycan/LPS O-acetylase OafA/YrhL
MRHSANLDILRAFAVISVCVEHLVRTLNAHTGFHNEVVCGFTSQIGRAGVLAFFVHTSLVLMCSLERMASSTDRISLRFYIRRFFRIYPLSIFCVTLAVILHIPSNTWRAPDIVTPSVIFSNLLLVQNVIAKGNVIGPLWSLPFEVQMYLVLPVLYFLTRRRRAVAGLCCLLTFFCCLGFLSSWYTSGRHNPTLFVPCFLCGVLCYSLRGRVREFIPAVFWPAFVLLLVSGYCMLSFDNSPKFWVDWIFCILLGLSINAFHNSAYKTVNAVAEKLALYSYSVYLIHLPVLYLVFMVLDIKNVVFGPLLFVVLTMIVSVVTYQFIESPFIEFGRRMSSGRLCVWACLPEAEKQEAL